MTDRTTMTFPDSGRSTTIAPLDVFELALDDDVPNIFLGAINRLLLGNLIYAGIATKEERDEYNKPVEFDNQSLFISYLVEKATEAPKLVRDLTKARDYKAQGVAVDLQSRYSQRDLIFAFDAALGRGGRLYASIFPDHDAQSTTDDVELVSADAGNAPSTESIPEHTDERELAGVPA